MQKITTQKIKSPQSDIDRLNIATNLANELCFTALRSSEENKTEVLEALAKQYSNAVKLDADELNAALQHGLDEISERASYLNIAVGKSVMLGAIKTWVGQAEEPEAIEQTDDYMGEINALDALENVPEANQTPEQILSSGIQYVTNTLVSDYALNDILQMVLETMFRGMNFNRILILVRDSKLNAIRARFGFGKDIEKLIPQFSFPLAFAPDVFHVALEKGVDIVIEDVLAANIASKIPEWHQKAVTAKSFLLLPVMVNNKAIGLFYADTEDAQGMKISTQQLGLLRTLRNQAVLAIKQKM
jgi:GAF domain-containing protein